MVEGSENQTVPTDVEDSDTDEPTISYEERTEMLTKKLLKLRSPI